MVNATLWYANTDGQTHLTVPSQQRIVFNSSGNKYFAPIDHDYFNNIKQIPNPQNLGVRQINVTENGLKDANYPVAGFIKISDIDHEKLVDFMQVEQITTNLPFGRFGIDYPNLPKLSFIPTLTKGLAIGPVHFHHNSTNKTLEFTYTMLFGGLYAQ